MPELSTLSPSMTITSGQALVANPNIRQLIASWLEAAQPRREHQQVLAPPGHPVVNSLPGGSPAVWMRGFLRWSYGLLYNQLAWTYDLVSWIVSAGQWRAWQRSALPFLPGRPVLEVAHGTGNLLLDLLSLGLEPVGLDL